MKALHLSALLELVADRLGLDRATVDAAVVRTDVHPARGVTLELEGAATGRRWFRGDGTRFEELRPHEDPGVPLCATLARGALPLAWRPRRRVLVANEGGSFTKGYRRGRVAGAARVHGAFEAAAARVSGLSVPSVLAVDEDSDALTLGRLDGPPVELTRSSGELFFALGEGLRGLQRELDGAALPRFDVADELGVLADWRARVELAGVAAPAGWDALLGAVQEQASVLPPTEPVAVHRDLHDGQLVDLGGSVGLLDLDLACRADALLDVANLLAHLELRLLQGLGRATRAGVDACAEGLLEGLDGVQGDAWPRLRFYQATSFLRLALVYSLRPRWHRLSVDLTGYARRCLEDLVRIA